MEIVAVFPNEGGTVRQFVPREGLSAYPIGGPQDDAGRPNCT